MLNPAELAKVPLIDAHRAVSLGEALLALAPDRPELAPFVQAIRDRIESLKKAIGPTIEHGSISATDADTEIDNAWKAVVEALAALARLPHALYPRAARAAVLIEQLFPGGVAWLNTAYGAQWSASEALLGLIEEKGMKAELAALTDQDMILELERAHLQYGIVLGITKPKAVPAAVSADPTALLAAIRGYAWEVVRTVAMSDQSALDRANATLAPLSQARLELRSRRASKKAPAQPPG